MAGFAASAHEPKAKRWNAGKLTTASICQPSILHLSQRVHLKRGVHARVWRYHGYRLIQMRLCPPAIRATKPCLHAFVNFHTAAIVSSSAPLAAPATSPPLTDHLPETSNAT